MKVKRQTGLVLFWNEIKFVTYVRLPGRSPEEANSRDGGEEGGIENDIRAIDKRSLMRLLLRKELKRTG